MCLCTAPASFALAADEAAHNAFIFADRKDWPNAMAHAKRASSAALRTLIQWEYALDPDSGASFQDITAFIKAHPNWPDQKKLRLRAEMALRTSDVDNEALIAWFGDDTPISGVGKIALAKALARTKNAKNETITTLVRDAWKDGDFDEAQEEKILEEYGTMLRKEDHIARVSRLLWEERITPAKRVLHHVPDTHQKLFKARIALQQDKSLAALAIAQVPSSLKNDPGLIYDRMLYRERHDDNNGVRDMLLAAPDKPPYPEKWWRHREYQVRKAIDDRQYALAAKLLARHGQTEGQSYADALWLQGWLKTEFLKDAAGSYRDFNAMYRIVRYPVSRARAAYWAGRAAAKTGDSKSSKEWFEEASSFPTTFYGQLATLALSKNPSLDIPDSPPITTEAKSAFNSSDVTQAIKLAIADKQIDLATRLIALIIENSDDEAEIAQLAELGANAGQVHLSVHAAKKALQQNVVMIKAGYPTPKTPSEKPIERALTLAITRQESEFDPRAKSPTGALGMMQLMPGTAKETARKHGMAFSKDRLAEPAYNMTLGSYYLGRLIGSYDGSYILAIAAYNGGPGNVRNWTHNFGTPDNNLENAINWIEKIPYRETRNYVQRVLENLQVFRHILSEDSSPKLKLGDDLVR